MSMEFMELTGDHSALPRPVMTFLYDFLQESHPEDVVDALFEQGVISRDSLKQYLNKLAAEYARDARLTKDVDESRWYGEMALKAANAAKSL